MAFPTKQIARLVASGYPLIYLVSWEEERVEKALRQISQKLYKNPIHFLTWSCTDGLEGEGGNLTEGPELTEALDRVIGYNEKAFFLFKDLQFFQNEPQVIRKLKDVYRKIRGTNKTVFILSHTLESIPEQLEKELTVLDIGLPDIEEASSILGAVLNSNKNYQPIKDSLSNEDRDRCIRVLLGLGALEMELALKRSFLGKSAVDDELIELILEEKGQMVKKSGALELFTANSNIDEIGGLDNLKEWLRIRAVAFTSKAKEFGLDQPRGVLVMGVSGCGKSLCAKAIATAWNLPLLRLDLNQIYSGSLGGPEESFRKAIKTVEAVSPCILWIDEIEAGITRSGEKSGDSPAARIFGYFLTWMQEKTHSVFIAATANQIDLLPPEILRKGRFDEIFFVSLPTESERREIFKIHLDRRGKDHFLFDIKNLAKNTDGLSGAEIEQVVISALYESLAMNKELDDRELVIASSSIVPLSTTMREEISKLERWAGNRAVKASKTST
ncbi:MAG: AAA family ATPase [Candidatus Dadabacteria bacterium]|nr:AAA family ATPase [Candidatus Dadabacteria bacterium]